MGSGETPDEVGAHVENGIADVLREKYAGPEPHGPLRGRAPCDTQTRREVFVIRLHQAVSQTAVPRDCNSGVEPDRHALIKIASTFAHKHRMQLWIAYISER